MKKIFNIENKSRLNYLFLLTVLLSIICVISTAVYMQDFMHETPCPLCLLERLCFFGIAFGTMLQLRGANKYHSLGITFAFIVLLSIHASPTSEQQQQN